MLYRLFRRDPESRDDIITVTSALGIVTNLLIAVAKMSIGALAASIAIVSEGINNLADALTSILTLLGAKLARKHPDEKHPFGYGRIEYLAGLIIATMILVTGAEVLISSVRLIFEPAELSVSYLAIGIVAGSAVIKFLLGTYTVRMGKKADSSALTGVGLDCRNDSFASVITIAASLVYLLFGVSVDAWAGILTAGFILKAGFDVLKDTVGDLLGRPGEAELASTLYREIRETEGISGAADMMLHNYGPDAWSGSVNVEIDQKKTVGEIYQILHRLQLHIMHTYHVTMVFGVYAVDNEHEEIREIRRNVAAFAKQHEHIRGIHAVYLEPETRTIYCDFVVDYNLRDWDGLRGEFLAAMAEAYPGRQIELTIETEYV